MDKRNKKILYVAAFRAVRIIGFLLGRILKLLLIILVITLLITIFTALYLIIEKGMSINLSTFLNQYIALRPSDFTVFGDLFVSVPR